MKIPDKIKYRKKKYTKYSIHSKKNAAIKECEKLKIEGHLSVVKSFSHKHIVYIKRQKLTPYPNLAREVYKIVDRERFDMITFGWNREEVEKYAKKYKGTLFSNYRIFKERVKYGKNKGKKRYVIYGKKV